MCVSEWGVCVEHVYVCVWVHVSVGKQSLCLGPP